MAFANHGCLTVCTVRYGSQSMVDYLIRKGYGTDGDGCSKVSVWLGIPLAELWKGYEREAFRDST